MTAAIGETVLFTPLPEHRHLLPAWLRKLLDGAETPVQMPQYAAIVGDVRVNGSLDLAVLVPNRELTWMDAVAEGIGPGTWQKWTPTTPPAPPQTLMPTALPTADLTPAPVPSPEAAMKVPANAAEVAAASAPAPANSNQA